MRHDAIARSLVPVADSGDVPLIDALSRARIDGAAEGHDTCGGLKVIERYRPGPGRRRWQSLTGETFHGTRRELWVRLGPGRDGTDRQAARGGEATKMRGADHALGGAVQTHEDDARGGWLCPSAAVRVQRVVHRELTRHVVEVVAAGGLKTGGGRVQAGRLRCELAVV